MDSRQHLDRKFHALASTTRRAILDQLRAGETNVKALAAPHQMSMPAISRHLKVLERAGLIQRVIDGRFHRCNLVPGAINDAAEWLEVHRQFWNARLDALSEYVDSINETDRSEKND